MNTFQRTIVFMKLSGILVLIPEWDLKTFQQQ